MFSAPGRRTSVSHVGHTRQTAEMEKRLGEYIVVDKISSCKAQNLQR